MTRQWYAKGAFSLALVALLLPACTGPDQNAGGPAPESNVSAEDVTDETAELIGQAVTIRSEVINKVGESSFTLSDEQWLNGEEILVLNASGEPFIIPIDDTEVQVTGTVERFVTADLEREYDLDLQPDVYANYESQPAIVAQSIAVAPEPGEITEDPSQYYGQTLAVTGEVEEIIGPNAFTLEDEELLGSDDLLVLNTTTGTTVEDGEEVAITGELRSFVSAEIERDYDLTWDLDLQRQLEAEYQQQPVLIVRDIYPSAE
ncbi:hypothetical protein IQ268_28440 [Oculatella sp. LEGE 06141]|uniref:hypothetical protein n=1 Tax=Oculatella sp. LEGE 06141 TaxID=1828648 RepID=UPI001880FCD9|nr:hypothetical protein [Oculatella sp. LEGE 06141]MBE9182483.1 hypothetical protein [Oculatella sp. LEGE 06141]